MGDLLSIGGDEGWDDLVRYRRKLRRPSISFYGDKVAQKRWMRAMNIPVPKSFVLKYDTELTQPNERKDEEKAIDQLIPRRTNFVAKPTTYRSSSRNRQCLEGKTGW